ncbi:MAG: glycosyltransferase family 2 protein [Vampirovibrionales bacterium]|nr:glycosyltransferase family 2 protein [Vampirovibrionales bacterium]
MDVSFIVPVYNEEENVVPLIQELYEAGLKLNRPFEMVLVDDGSRDRTVEKLRRLADSFPMLRVAVLKRNYGQTAATAAGFAHAKGRYIVTLDGDLQNDPADAPALIEMMETEDLDIISGWRKHRKDRALTRKLPSAIANWLIAKVTGVMIHDNGCSLKVYRSEIAKDVPLYGEMHRFIPALASIDGAVIKEVPVHHRERAHGTSKYGLSRTFKVLLDLLTVVLMKRFFTRPIHLFGRAGLVLLFLGALALGVLFAEKLLFGHDIGARPMLLMGAMLVLTGIQLISTGLIAEIQVRTYFESQRKPIYKVKEVIDGADTANPARLAEIAVR